MPDFMSNQAFETNPLFVGGNGMFIEYHDMVKPVYLFALVKMMMDKETFLPFQNLSKLPPASLVEWYITRSFVNPLKELDSLHKYSEEFLDEYLQHILQADQSLYRLAPNMYIQQMLRIYNKQHMIFPIIIYTEVKEEYLEKHLTDILPGVSNVTYVYGDIGQALLKCDTNYTYIFSNIKTSLHAIEILKETYSNVIIGSAKYNNLAVMDKELKRLAAISYPMRLESMQQYHIKNILNSLREINYMGEQLYVET